MAGHCPGHHLRPLVTSAGKRTWQLQYGTRVIIDQDQPMTRPFFTCFSNGCVADYEATHHPGVARRALSRHVSSLAKATKEARLRKKDCGGLHPRRYIGRERGGDATRRGDEEECPGRSPPPKPGLLGKTPMTGPQPSSIDICPPVGLFNDLEPKETHFDWRRGGKTTGAAARGWSAGSEQIAR